MDMRIKAVRRIDTLNKQDRFADAFSLYPVFYTPFASSIRILVSAH